jgi:hypothetical protein
MLGAGVYVSVRKRYLFPPPPFWKWYFFPPLGTSRFFDSHHSLFALILPYFAFILPFNFPFSQFLSPFFIFLSPFFLFSFIFSPFFSSPFHIFSPKWHWLIFPPPQGGWGIFQYIGPCVGEYWMFMKLNYVHETILIVLRNCDAIHQGIYST